MQGRSQDFRKGGAKCKNPRVATYAVISRVMFLEGGGVVRPEVLTNKVAPMCIPTE